MIRDMTNARILIVDDEQVNIQILRRILGRAGFNDLITTVHPREAVPLFIERKPDLLLLDLHMPGCTGFEVLEMLHPNLDPTAYFPVLVLTGDATSEAKTRALEGGAKDFLAKPFDASEVMLRIRNLLETRMLYAALQDQNMGLEDKVAERTAELEGSQIEILDRLARAAELRDDDTGRHTQRVGELSARIAAALDSSSVMVEVLRRAAPLHDVGKIGIPDGILLKAGRLTPAEFEIVKTHSTIGAGILSGGRSDLVTLAERIALCHHERWDGSGYPHGLDGDDIPLEARIVAVADVFDALSHDRPYRLRWPLDAVLAHIGQAAGSHFDPKVVRALLESRCYSYTARGGMAAVSEHDDDGPPVFLSNDWRLTANV